ncbi:MAG TPA: polymer-forming cytoskeletal protein [Chthoniobacteraceae bacterium]|jgi:cytoskeletal protein CcmA (bactofilin family)|nr:polymer-forming cytoskeletal protein [Chthoniobacteraceae bacterium]
MAKGLAKITVACPYCGGTQQESEHARSTFCRKCGRHIELGGKRSEPHSHAPAPGPTQPAEPEEPGLMDRFTRLFQREKVRQINCLHCNAPQTVSSLAKSGSCVQCGHYLDFRDIKIDSNFSKSIETHGIITITKSGELTSPKLSCAAAIVAGKVNGNLVCSTTAHLTTRGRIVGSITARQLIIEKKADVEFVRPLHVGTVEINGKISARIFADSVTINKNGALEGAVTAKSIKIERGGIFHGDLIIGQQKEEQQELSLGEQARARQKKRDMGGNQMLLRPAT